MEIEGNWSEEGAKTKYGAGCRLVIARLENRVSRKLPCERWTFALLPELLISRQLVATSVERQAGRRHYLLRVRVREGECPPHQITMATPVRPATASCPACFHVLPAWRLLTSQTPLSTITYKTSSSFFHFFSSSLFTKKSVYSGQTRFRPSSSWRSFRKKTRRGYTLHLIPPINFAIFFRYDVVTLE